MGRPQKGQTRTNWDGQVQIGKHPRFKNPPVYKSLTLLSLFGLFFWVPKAEALGDFFVGFPEVGDQRDQLHADTFSPWSNLGIKAGQPEQKRIRLTVEFETLNELSPKGPVLGDLFLSSAGAGGNCARPMRLPHPSPVLDIKIVHPWASRNFISSTGPLGLGSGERLLWRFQTPILYWITNSLQNN